jgi:hypothetical protein
MRIDTTLVNPLQNLRPASFGGPDAPANDPSRNLAFRNLTRAGMVQLATGQQMVAMLKNRGVPVTALTKDQLRNGNRGATLDDLTARQRQAVLEHTPLWFYILREAEVNRGKLTGVGARILAETFHRAMEGSRHSIVRHRTWQPSFGPDSKTFRDGPPAGVRLRGQEVTAEPTRLTPPYPPPRLTWRAAEDPGG